MPFDYSLAALVAVGLLFYLIYALLRPERFEADKACTISSQRGRSGRDAQAVWRLARRLVGPAGLEPATRPL